MSTAIAIRPKQLPLITGFTEMGYRPPKNITLKEWAEDGKILARVGRAVAWALGDWMLTGEAMDEEHSQYLDELGASYDHRTLSNYANVCKAFPMADRHPELSFSHHAVVYTLESNLAHRLLKLAVDNEWTVAQLRKAMAGEDPTEEKPSKNGHADPTATEAEAQLDVVVERDGDAIVKISARSANFTLEPEGKKAVGIRIGGRRFQVYGNSDVIVTEPKE